MTRPRLAGFPAFAALVGLAAATLGCGGGDIDQRIATAGDAAVTVDIELGSGVSFDRGSLQISTHPREEVHVIVETTGWGGYAVDLDIAERDGDVRIAGRVDGALHWMFGGPTVDVRVLAPLDARIHARIDGGDLLLEDLGGPVDASVDDTQLTLLRADGDVRLESAGGHIRVEDVNGRLDIDSGGGGVEATGIDGRVQLRSGDGDVALTSVNGRVDVETSRGAVELERIRGNVRATSERGSIDIADLVGELDVSTQRGRIEVDELQGPIRARSQRGGIQVGFDGPPSGSIETLRGAIHVVVPPLGGFAVDADTRRGKIDFSDGLVFVPTETAIAAGPSAEEQLRALQDLGERVAMEVKARVEQGVEQARRQWERRREGDRGWHPHEEWQEWQGGERSWPWESPDWQWPDADWPNRVGESAKRWGIGGWRGGEQLTGDVNGGGQPLKLRSDRGSIRVDAQ